MKRETLKKHQELKIQLSITIKTFPFLTTMGEVNYMLFNTILQPDEKRIMGIVFILSVFKAPDHP